MLGPLAPASVYGEQSVNNNASARLALDVADAAPANVYGMANSNECASLSI
jgi:hypothetical protein